jgi:protein tyrosine/serine phosphatase
VFDTAWRAGRAGARSLPGVHERLVPLVGADNFRDLGGYPALDGRMTRWGRVYRSDAHSELTPEDVEHLRNVGVTTVVDLRTSRESDHDRGGPLVAEGARYHHHPVIPQDTEPGFVGLSATTDVCERYLWFLDVGAPSIAATFSVLADETAYGVVFHCSAGKDRTGVLSALLLDCLGVDRDVIVSDYMLTRTRLDHIHARIRRHPAFHPDQHDLNAPMFQIEATTMVRFLRELDGRFGGAVGWCRRAGVPEDMVERLRDLLLEA